MSYQGKNYSTDGGDTLHIGGNLEFGEGGGFKNFPAAKNVAPSTASSYTGNKTTINEILISLKNAGLMVADDWNISIPSGITFINMPKAQTTTNSNKVTSVLEDGTITVSVGGAIEDELSKADHGTGWGEHYWIGIGIRTGMDTDAGIKFTQLSGMEADKEPTEVTLTIDDDTEANSVGLASAGDIILYIKSEVVRDNGGMAFTLWANGYKTETINIVIDETEED